MLCALLSYFGYTIQIILLHEDNKRMVQLRELISYCDDLLEADRFRDYCPNGLQVEGREQISKLVTGVTASQALIDAAIEADLEAELERGDYDDEVDDG